jgi:hypothetical protein
MDFGAVGIMDMVPVINIMVVVFGLVMIQTVDMGNTILGIIQIHTHGATIIAMIMIMVIGIVVDMIVDI